MWRDRLDDWRWRLAHAAWAPANAVEARIERWASRCTQYMPHRLRMLAGLELLPGFRHHELPWRFRVARALIVEPCGKLSQAIFPDWEENQRAQLSYWTED